MPVDDLEQGRKAPLFRHVLRHVLSASYSISPYLEGLFKSGAGEGNRTLVSGLGSPHSTIEPHPLKISQSQELTSLTCVPFVKTVQTPMRLVILVSGPSAAPGVGWVGTEMELE